MAAPWPPITPLATVPLIPDLIRADWSWRQSPTSRPVLGLSCASRIRSGTPFDMIYSQIRSPTRDESSRYAVTNTQPPIIVNFAPQTRDPSNHCRTPLARSL